MLNSAISGTTGYLPRIEHTPDCSYSTLHFSANTEHGPVGISLTGSELSTLTDLNVLLELSRLEPFIAMLEDWLGIGLDFHSLSASPGYATLLSIRNASPDFQQIDVFAPVQLWAHKPAPLAELESIGIKTFWPKYHARLALGTLPFSENDKKQLDRGSVVLIPDSFQTEWRVYLCVPALDYLQTGLLVKDVFFWQGMLEFPTTVKADSSTATKLDDAGCYFELSTKQILAGPVELQGIVNTALKHSNVNISCNDGKGVSGSLIQVGTGYGLQVTRVFGASL